jgi:hypothetical protein
MMKLEVLNVALEAIELLRPIVVRIKKHVGCANARRLRCVFASSARSDAKLAQEYFELDAAFSCLN